MKIRYLLIVIVFGIFFLPVTAIAISSYGEMDVYFNDNILPGKEIAKPTLKINEPFNIKINMTAYQECKVSGKLTELGEGYFEVIEGPSEMNQYSRTVLMANESHIFEWTVIPTDKWAGGSMPINFHYSIIEKGNPEPVVNSEFTVAYCTISNEYYEGETPTSKEQPVPETEPSSTSAAAPAFTLACALSVLALAFALFRR
ncbi:sarcinarray family MAST domain-containing protein [Methanosarcina sp. T3]|uniref:sarcinarray family MAST domain-containing protein n=1 Tax=Methanosarcina sp. T3 TaxID=3439062 RepID=UPI003F83054F